MEQCTCKSTPASWPSYHAGTRFPTQVCVSDMLLAARPLKERLVICIAVPNRRRTPHCQNVDRFGTSPRETLARTTTTAAAAAGAAQTNEQKTLIHLWALVPCQKTDCPVPRIALARVVFSSPIHANSLELFFTRGGTRRESASSPARRRSPPSQTKRRRIRFNDAIGR